MSTNWGTNLELSIFGESHGKSIGIVIGNLPAGIQLDEAMIVAEMKRRAPGRSELTTSRQEADQVEIVSGMLDGYTTGAPLCGMIHNTDQRSHDYQALKALMRPGHSDYPAYVKFHGYNDVRGGGMFSGRLTAPIVFAGAIAKQVLKTKGICVGAHILSIGQVRDQRLPVDVDARYLDWLQAKTHPTIDDQAFVAMTDAIMVAKARQDSIGGKIECALTGVAPGIGRPFFDSVESHLSSLLFSIPAVKSISFGDHDDVTALYGSEANDAYYYDVDDVVKTRTNHNGGITGGITNGMPIVLTVGIKPTPSIGIAQETVNVIDHCTTMMQTTGRHDPCIVPRAVVVVEAMCAIGLLDMINI